MARIKNNVITHGLSGKLGGNIVFKQYGNKTIVSAYPDMSRVKPSESQKKQRTRFKKAMMYAKYMMKDPVCKAEYHSNAKGTQTAYNVAVADFYHPPVIHKIATAFKNGFRVIVDAQDDFKVKKVEVEISEFSGEVIFKGDASLQEDEKWVCLMDQNSIIPDHIKIKVRAFDMPGNIAEEVLEINVSHIG